MQRKQHRRFLTAVTGCVACLLLAFSVQDSEATPQWQMVNANAHGTANVPWLGPQSASFLWELDVNTGSGWLNDPILIGEDGTVYAICNSHLLAVDPAGSVKWSKSIATVRGLALSSSGRLYFTGDDKKLHAYTSTGTELSWSPLSFPGNLGYPVVGSDGTIFAPCDDGYVYAISSSGQVRWRTYVKAEHGRHCALGYSGRLYVPAAQSPYDLYCLNAANGAVIWQYGDSDIAAKGIPGGVAVGPDDTVYFAIYGSGASGSGKACAVNSDGTLKWKHPISYQANSVSLCPSRNRVYFGTNHEGLYAFDLAGSQVGQFKPGTYSDFYASATIASDGTVYAVEGYYQDTLYALSGDLTTVKWSYHFGRNSHSPVTVGTDGRLYIGGNSDKILAFGLDYPLGQQEETVSQNGIPQEATDTGCSQLSPFYIESGIFEHRATDILLSARGLPLQFTRSYNNRDL
ncbi:MAG: PQQ-like beta-propeller repeat protein, partial [Sedimentisphaerales bacterium]|nr:PQQ-like beta-propeller repeat protein [Sedimentisphaerales bacterium]